MQNPRGKGGKAGDKTGGHHKRCFPGKCGYTAHSIVIFGSKIISHQGHKTLAQPHGNVEWQLVNALDNAVSGHGNIPIAGSKPHHHHVGGVCQSSCQCRGEAYREYGPCKSECEMLGVERDRGFVFQTHILNYKKHHRGCIGNRRSKGGTCNFHVEYEY